MASKNTKRKLRNRSKSGVVDEFESQSKKFRNGINKMKPNHGNKRQTSHLEDPMNDEVTAKVKSSQVAESKKMTFKTTKKRETWKVVNKMKPNYGNQCQNPMNDKVMAKEESSQVEREKMTVKTTKKRETWEVVNKMKPKQRNQCQNRMNDKVMAKEKSSQVNEKEKMTTKAAMKKRETWNGGCGTNIVGAFEQICDNIENEQNDIRTETSLDDQIFNEEVEIAQKIEEKEENHIKLQKLVKKPATRDIRKENSSYQPKVLIRIRKDLPQITSAEELPADTSESPAKPKQHPGPSQSLTTSKQPRGFKSPVNCQHPEGPSRHRVIITPFVSTMRTSSSTGSSGDTKGHIHSRATTSQVTSPIIGSGGITGHINNGANGNSSPLPEFEHYPGPSKSLATSKQPSGTAETSKFPVNCEHPEVPTPIRSSSSNSFSTCSSGETTGRIKERVIRSQGNSPVTNEVEEATGPLNDGAIQCTGQHLTIKFETGDVTVTDGGRTVQMKMTNASISGQADDVNNIVKTFSQVVRDLK